MMPSKNRIGRGGSSFPWQDIGGSGEPTGKNSAKRSIAANIDCRRSFEGRLSAVFDAVGDGLILVDEDVRILALNRAARRIFGYRFDEAVGRPMSHFLPDTRRTQLEKIIARCLNGKSGTLDRDDVSQMSGRRKDGSIFPLELAVAPIADGARRRVICTTRDASAVMLGRDTVRAGGARLGDIAGHLPVLVAHIGRDHRYRSCNPAHDVWFGLSQEQIVGRHVRQVLGKDIEATTRPHAQSALAGLPSEFEATLSFRYGGRRHVNAVFVPDFGEDGTSGGYCVLIIDLSDRLRSEERPHDVRRKGSGPPSAGESARYADVLLDELTARLEALRDAEGADRDRLVGEALSIARSGWRLVRRAQADDPTESRLPSSTSASPIEESPKVGSPASQDVVPSPGNGVDAGCQPGTIGRGDKRKPG